MFISKEQRIKDLEIRINKLSTNIGENSNLVKKAERELRKLRNS